MILKHRDKELLRFDWIGDVRVRIVSVNDAERLFLPLEFGEKRTTCEEDALRYPLEDWLASRSAENNYYAIRNYLRDKRPALFRTWLGFPYVLTEDLLNRLAALETFRFKKHRHYDWTDERRDVLSGFLQKRVSDIRRFERKVDEKDEQSLNVELLIPNENVGVKSLSGSGLNASEQKAVLLILGNAFITEEEIANQLNVTIRQAERIIAALKKKAGLARRGSDKTGEWYYDVVLDAEECRR